MKIGDTDIRQVQRANGDGPKETITKSDEGVTYNVEDPEGNSVTIQDNMAVVEHADGSMFCFRRSGSEFKFFEDLGGGSSGEVQNLSKAEDLIKSALVMFEKASASEEGFEEVDEIV